MKDENSFPQETRMVRSRPWSTFPKSRSFTRTVPSATPVCRNASCTGRRVTQKQFKPKTFKARVPEQVATSMSIVLGRTNATLDERDEQIHILASFFASSVSQTAKLKRLRVLVALVTPEEALWQLREAILRDTLRFLTCRSFDWPHDEHTAHVLLLELRAMCLYQMERQSIIIQTSQIAAGCIFGAARMLEAGLASSVPIIHFGLDLAGNQAKRYMIPATIPSTPSSRRNQIVTRAYTSVAKRATGSLLVTIKFAASSIRDASTDRIHHLAQRMDQEQWGQRIIPHEGPRNVLVAVGTVGIASLGAAAIVGEAVVATTASVALKAAEVAASVVRYKYGEHAGQVIEDASQTTGNILRTTSALALLELSVLSRSVAKNTIKVQAKRIHEGEEEESTVDGGNIDLLTALRAGSFESHLLKIESQASFGVTRAAMETRPPTVSTMIRIESESKDTNVQMKGGPNSD